MNSPRYDAHHPSRPVPFQRMHDFIGHVRPHWWTIYEQAGRESTHTGRTDLADRIFDIDAVLPDLQEHLSLCARIAVCIGDDVLRRKLKELLARVDPEPEPVRAEEMAS